MPMEYFKSSKPEVESEDIEQKNADVWSSALKAKVQAYNTRVVKREKVKKPKKPRKKPNGK